MVVNHVFLRAFPGYPVDHAPFWAAPFIYGRFAVVVFIVVSGFSLALSPARHGWRLDGIRRFARRRAWRILPAYWAALAFSLAVAWMVTPPPGQAPPGARSVVVNGLLVQNVVGAPSPNRSFWSMAIEVQLYVLLPLLVLAVRRWGAMAHARRRHARRGRGGELRPHAARLRDPVPPDLAALFALGIVAAGVARRSLPWGWLALAAVAPVLVTIWWRGSAWTLGHLFWVDLALGPAIACLLLGLAAGRPAWLLRTLDARPLRALGESSYSLYLTHGPIVVLICERVVVGRGALAFAAALALALPATIVFARAFASVFEAPFREHRGWPWALRRDRLHAGGVPA